MCNLGEQTLWWFWMRVEICDINYISNTLIKLFCWFCFPTARFYYFNNATRLKLNMLLWFKSLLLVVSGWFVFYFTVFYIVLFVILLKSFKILFQLYIFQKAFRVITVWHKCSQIKSEQHVSSVVSLNSAALKLCMLLKGSYLFCLYCSGGYS